MNQLPGGHDIVVIGASAGGVEALMLLVGGLPPEFAAAVFVVLHMPADSPSALAAILQRSGRLPVLQAEDGQPIEPGHIFRICVPSTQRHYCVVVKTDLPLQQSVRFAGYELNAVFSQGAW